MGTGKLKQDRGWNKVIKSIQPFGEAEWLKAFDIIFLDWFLQAKAHFFQYFYPETEECAAYNQFGFNRKEQLAGIILFPFLAVLLAWICTIL